LTTGSEAVRVLTELFEGVKDQAHKFAGGSSSNICEALNNAMTVYAPKRNNLGQSYDWRVNLAFLIHNEGAGIKAIIMQQLGLPIPEKATIMLKRKEVRREYFQKRKKTEALKSKRAQQKENKKKRGKRIINEAHTYKGGHTPEDEVDDNSLVTREPKVKKSRSESERDSCGCLSQKACLTRSCTCVAKQNKCNEKCKCTNICKSVI
jgi:hypothetical protein